MSGVRGEGVPGERPETDAGGRRHPGRAGGTHARRAGAVLAAVALAGAALAIYAPALDGPFLSDDFAYIPNNVYVRALGARELAAILDPAGEPARATANYAPVHLLLHGLEWRAFGPRVRGYHLVNAILHAGAALLVGGLLARLGVPRAGAAFGAALFLVHPANVEAVAWISQLKTVASCALALAALLVWRRAPAASLPLFALALLTKFSAVFALALAIAWAACDDPGPVRRRRAWAVAAWLAVTAAVAVPQAIAATRAGVGVPELHTEADVRVRTVFALAARYLAMAGTSYGVSAFQEPEPARAWLDPWWLAGLAAVLLLGARTLVAARRRAPEAAGWLAAAAAFVPVAQIGPLTFQHPIADRYLYAMLPGLLAGALFATRGAWARLEAGLRRFPDVPAAAALAAAAAALVLGGFAWRSHERAAIWRSGPALVRDAAAHYPDGIQARLLEATAAARAGDAEAVAAALRAAYERGYDAFRAIRDDPHFRALRGDPALDAVLADMARRWAARAAAVPDPPPGLLVELAEAHELLGDRRAARAALERAAAGGGPLEPAIRARLRQLPPD